MGSCDGLVCSFKKFFKNEYTEERLRVTLFIGVCTKQQSKRREGESNGRFGKSLFIH